MTVSVGFLLAVCGVRLLIRGWLSQLSVSGTTSRLPCFYSVVSLPLRTLGKYELVGLMRVKDVYITIRHTPPNVRNSDVTWLSHLRSEGWPHHGSSFSTDFCRICPLNDMLPKHVVVGLPLCLFRDKVRSLDDILFSVSHDVSKIA